MLACILVDMVQDSGKVGGMAYILVDMVQGSGKVGDMVMRICLSSWTAEGLSPAGSPRASF